MRFRDRTVRLEEGELIVVPRGVEHCPAAEEEVHVIFEYDDLLRFEGLRALDESEHTMHVEGNRAELTHLGECDYVLVFSDRRSSGSPIHLSITGRDGLIFEKSIVPGGE